MYEKQKISFFMVFFLAKILVEIFTRFFSAQFFYKIRIFFTWVFRHHTRSIFIQMVPNLPRDMKTDLSKFGNRGKQILWHRFFAVQKTFKKVQLFSSEKNNNEKIEEKILLIFLIRRYSFCNNYFAFFGKTRGKFLGKNSGKKWRGSSFKTRRKFWTKKIYSKISIFKSTWKTVS